MGQSRNILRLIGLICFCFSLAACHSFQNGNSNNQAICKEMKSEQVFSAPTNDQSKVWQDRAGDDRLAQDYRAHCN